MLLCSVQLYAYIILIGGSIPHKQNDHEQPSWDYSNTKWRHAGAVEFLLGINFLIHKQPLSTLPPMATHGLVDWGHWR